MQGDFRLGDWLVCPQLNTVQHEGRSVRLEPKCMQVLVCLANRPASVVSKDELMRSVWTDTFVTDDVLTRAISELRRVFADDARHPQFIETVARVGYRVIAPVGTNAAGPPLAYPSTQVRNSSIHIKALVIALALITGAVVIIVAVRLRRTPAETLTHAPRPIAVLPLQNTRAAQDLDFLRIGLADDIANTLSYYPGLTIRPFATVNRYTGADVDLQKAAREMRVENIVTGHFVVEGEQVEVTLEAIDAARNRVLWHETLRASTRDLVGLQQQLVMRVQHGLLTALGMNANWASAQASHNEEAYELFLRAVSEPDSTINDSIRLLQRAVALDPGYALAWATLGHFYYYDSALGTGGKASRLRARAALERALALEPGRLDAATDLINMESEEGALNRAYDDISQLLRHHPESGAVHLVRAYVLWYAGLLNDAASECGKARTIDAGTTDLASCGYVFMALSQYDRASDYFRLQSGTEYEGAGKVEILLREGKVEEAVKQLKSLPMAPFYGRQILEPCLTHLRSTSTTASQFERSEIMKVDDPLPKYTLAAWDSVCGQPEMADRELRQAIAQNYCAYPQMETDPLLAELRARSDFTELRTLGLACQQHFLEHKNKTDSN